MSRSVRKLARALAASAGCFALVGVAALASPSPARGHLSEGTYRWYVGGYTHVKISATRFRRADPVTVIFLRGGTASLSSVGDHLHDDWGGSVILETDMDDNSCADSGTQQWVVFRGLDDVASGHDQFEWDAQDESWSNNPDCSTQYHMRAWDDYEHYFQTTNHPSLNKWTIASIHREKRRFILFGKHILTQGFEASARVLRDRMNEHCSYLKWRWLPNSAVPGSKHPNSGYLTLIMMRHVNAPGDCPDP